MKVTIYTNKAKRIVDVPDSWSKVSTRAYQLIVRLWDQKDLVQLFSLLTGISYSTISLSDEQELEEALILSTLFIYTDPPFKGWPVPDTITIDGQIIVIPKQLGRLTIGQNVHVRNRLASARKYEELISFTTAIFLQPLIDRTDKFDLERAEQLEEKILDLPIEQTYPVGFFLLKPLIDYGRFTINGLSRNLQQSTASALRSLRPRPSKNWNLTRTSR